MNYSRRRLPHLYPEGRWLFVTWHLAASLPHALFPPPGKRSGSQAFVWMDRYLDSLRTGPAFLRQPAVAELVALSIRKGTELGHYHLRAWVIMPNHVHLLLWPLVCPSRLLQSLKGYTARQANRLLGRTGQSFWQAESYDHWVRSEAELERIVAYIENNPVRAGLVTCPWEYRWSSAAESVEPSLDAADMSVRATAEPPRP